MARKPTASGIPGRFGVGEWFGDLFSQMTRDERERAVSNSTLKVTDPERHVCPFRPTSLGQTKCSKQSGICSLQLYNPGETLGEAVPALGNAGALRAVCPNRFYEADLVRQWIGEVMLGDANPLSVSELRFLKPDSLTDWLLDGSPADLDDNDKEGVGRIDNVLIRPSGDRLDWCAVEVQAVYFSGQALNKDYSTFTDPTVAGTPFPKHNRRPDYRSSGPKRLMPQLQIKVPTLRRWGKKMAVVVDEAFFGHLGRMETVTDVSNADIAWFVVGFDHVDGRAKLAKRGEPHFTTLERAVEGLTAGVPVTLAQFESEIRRKMA